MNARRIVIVTGSKKWKDKKVIFEVLDDTLEELEADGFLMEIHVGDAYGADKIAQEWAAEKNERPFLVSSINRDQIGRVKVVVFRARWHQCGSNCGSQFEVHQKTNKRGEKYCPSAGMRRNAWMVQNGGHMCIAFILDCSSGATECADMAERAGIKPRRFRQGRLPADSSR